jgi:zinc protease
VIGTIIGALALLPTIMATTPASPSPISPVVRRPGPAGSLLVVDANHTVPLVHVVIASRAGAASDPRHREGLTNLAAEWARRGAGGRSREATDTALDELGATLEVTTAADSTRFEGEVLARNLEPFLALVGGMIVKPTFAPAELERTRHEIEGQIDESRNDDHALCARFFIHNLYADHPYGHPADGLKTALAAASPGEITAHFRRNFVGRNLIFAFAGDVEPDAVAAVLGRTFKGLSDAAAPPTDPLELRPPVPPAGWRIQLVDKPGRQQTQVMFGHPTLRATDRDYVALSVGLAAFGGHAMNAKLMDEVRRKRGLAYGAYLTVAPRRGVAPASGWVFTGAEKTVVTLKLVLRLYTTFMQKGLTPDEVAFFQRFVAGAYAAEMDDPDHRLTARVSAEIAGLPPDFVDTYPAQVKALTAAEVNAAIKRHVHAKDLAITMVATASEMKRRLLDAKIQESAIDVVPYESY